MHRMIGIAIIILTASVSARADRIVLTNGDRLTGTVVSYQNKVLEFRSALAGNVNIKTDDIQILEMDAPVPVVMQDDRKNMQQGKLTTNKDGVTLESTAGEQKVLWDAIVALGSAAEKVAAPPDDKMKWSGNASAGYSGYTGNVNFTMMNSNINVRAANPLWSFNTLFNSYYAEQQVTVDGHKENIRIGNLLHGGEEIDRKLTDIYTAYVQDDVDKNEFAKLNFRNLFTSGIKRKWFDDEKLKLSSRLGLGHEYELFEGGQEYGYGVGILGSIASYKVNDRIDLTQNTSWLPRLDDETDYRILAESAATLYLNQAKKFFVKTGLRHEYDSQPVNKLECLDMYYFSNIGLNF